MKQDAMERFKSWLTSRNKTTVLVAVGVLGILLILLSELLPEPETAATLPQPEPTEYNRQYVETLEADLIGALKQIDGVGAVSVYVTLESGVRYEYACEGKSTSDMNYLDEGRYAAQTSEESSIILVERDGGKEPLVLRRIEPSVQGVAVVCSGGDDPIVREEVVRVVCVLCGVKSNRVSVSKST